MAERVREMFCIDCIHLQKDEPIISGQMALYRCTRQIGNGRCIGWVQKDKSVSGLRRQGCGDCNRLYPGDMFDFKEGTSKKPTRYVYCGKKDNVRILLSVPDRVYTPVPNDYFRDQTGKLKRMNLQIVMQTEEQKELHRRLARNIMRKYYEK